MCLKAIWLGVYCCWLAGPSRAQPSCCWWSSLSLFLPENDSEYAPLRVCLWFLLLFGGLVILIECALLLMVSSKYAGGSTVFTKFERPDVGDHIVELPLSIIYDYVGSPLVNWTFRPFAVFFVFFGFLIKLSTVKIFCGLLILLYVDFFRGSLTWVANLSAVGGLLSTTLTFLDRGLLFYFSFDLELLTFCLSFETDFFALFVLFLSCDKESGIYMVIFLKCFIDDFFLK